MKSYDIRKGDTVKFRAGLTDKDRKRIIKFSRIVSGQDAIADYIHDNQIIHAGKKFKVKRCKQTLKKPTEYAVLITNSPNEILVPIQTRYFELIDRKPSHPLTHIFQSHG